MNHSEYRSTDLILSYLRIALNPSCFRSEIEFGWGQLWTSPNEPRKWYKITPVRDPKFPFRSCLKICTKHFGWRRSLLCCCQFRQTGGWAERRPQQCGPETTGSGLHKWLGTVSKPGVYTKQWICSFSEKYKHQTTSWRCSTVQSQFGERDSRKVLQLSISSKLDLKSWSHNALINTLQVKYILCINLSISQVEIKEIVTTGPFLARKHFLTLQAWQNHCRRRAALSSQGRSSWEDSVDPASKAFHCTTTFVWTVGK